jgi:hypothetical protein
MWISPIHIVSSMCHQGQVPGLTGTAALDAPFQGNLIDLPVLHDIR